MTSEGTRPNVLVFIADALRADRLHCYGNVFDTSPAIDGLAAEGVVFANAIAQSANTMPCVVSAFTGLDPCSHGLTDPRTHVRHSWGSWKTPFMVMEDAGYEVSGQDDWIYCHMGKHTQVADAAGLRQFAAARGGLPFFVWRMPDYTHLPYNPVPPYDTMFLPSDYVMTEETRKRMEIVKSRMIIHRPGLTSKFELEQRRGNEGDTWSGGIKRDDGYKRSAGVMTAQPEDRPAIAALYDGRVRMLDDDIGACVQALRKLDLLDDTIVVITGDHGEELLERGALGHTSCSLEGSLYDEAIHVPLIIRYPRALPKGKIVKEQVSQSDIMPTLLNLMGLEMPSRVDGRSLLPVIRGNAAGFVEETCAVTLTAGWQVLDDDCRKIWCVRTPVWKLIYYEYAPREENRYELFNLVQDPGEKRNVIAEHPETREMLKRRLQSWMRRGASSFMKEPSERKTQ